MSFRDHANNIMDNLIASGIWSAAIVLAVKFWPRIVAAFTSLRVAISSLPAALLRRLRALLPTRVSQSYGAIHDATPSLQSTLMTPSPGSLVLSSQTPPPGWPVGNASATVMAMQPPINRSPFMPTFVNNSQWAQFDAYQ